MATDEVWAKQHPDGTWTGYVRHGPVLAGLAQEEAERRAQESPKDVVVGAW